MSSVLALAQITAPVMIVTALGYVWRLRGMAFSHSFVTQFVSLVGAPALVFVTLLNSQFALTDIARVGGATLLCLLLFALVSSAALRLGGFDQRVYLPSLVFPNIGNMGLPICLYAFGERGLALAMIYFAITTIGQFTFGPAIARGQVTAAAVLRSPFLYSAIAAVGCSQAGVSFPDWALKTLHLLGEATIPLMLLGLGFALAEFGASAWRRQGLFALADRHGIFGRTTGGGVVWLHRARARCADYRKRHAGGGLQLLLRPRIWRPWRGSRGTGAALDAAQLCSAAGHFICGDLKLFWGSCHAVSQGPRNGSKSPFCIDLPQFASRHPPAR